MHSAKCSSPRIVIFENRQYEITLCRTIRGTNSVSSPIDSSFCNPPCATRQKILEIRTNTLQRVQENKYKYDDRGETSSIALTLL